MVGALFFSLDFPDPELAGVCFTLNPEKPIRIGRREDCEIHVNSKAFSRIQSTLYRRYGRWNLLDGGVHAEGGEPRSSANGTYVNGDRLPLADDRPLSYGDKISFGQPNAKALYLEGCNGTVVASLFHGPGWPSYIERVPLAERDPELLAALRSQSQPAEAEALPPLPVSPAGLTLWGLASQVFSYFTTTPQGLGGWLNRGLLVLLTLTLAIVVAGETQLLTWLYTQLPVNQVDRPIERSPDAEE